MQKSGKKNGFDNIFIKVVNNPVRFTSSSTVCDYVTLTIQLCKQKQTQFYFSEHYFERELHRTISRISE